MRLPAQQCPVARAVDLMAEPWTLLIVRELVFGGQSVAEISRGVPRMSPTTLARRLSTLVGAGLAERVPAADDAGSRYHLTIAGDDLRPIVELLGHWGRRWMPAPRPGDLDPDLLLFDISRQIDRARLPARPVSIRIDFVDGPPPRRWWLVLSQAAAVADHTDPGIPLLSRLDCTLAALAGIWLGYIPWLDAVQSGHVRITGDRDTTGSIIHWIGVSRFAREPAPSTADG